MSQRDEILKKVQAGTMDRKEAAYILHMTTTRIGQLLKDLNSGGPMPKERPPYTRVAPEKASPPAPTGTGEAGSAAPPVDLDAALKAAQGGIVTTPSNDVPAPTPPGGPVRRIVPAYDPDDVDAAREFLTVGRSMIVENIAEYAYDIDSSDPELEPLKKEGKILKVALKRNPEKAAKLGKIFSGWGGLIFALVFESAAVAREVRKIAQKREKAAELEKQRGALSGDGRQAAFERIVQDAPVPSTPRPAEGVSPIRAALERIKA